MDSLFNLKDVRCKYCHHVDNYYEHEIIMIIHVMDVKNNFSMFEVKCKGKCQYYIDVSDIIPINIANRIKTKVDKTYFSCPRCHFINKSTDGFLIKLGFLIFECEHLKYRCCCGKIFYIDIDEYPIITNFLRDKLTDDRLYYG